MSIDNIASKIACHDLMVSLGSALDRNANAEAADYFTEDGVVARPEGDISGPAVRAFFAKRPAEIVTRHVISNVIVRPIDDISAEGQAYVAVYRVPAQPNTLPRRLPQTPNALGDWLLKFRKTARGWQISRFEPVPMLAPAE